MTTIAAVVHDGQAWMAADGRAIKGEGEIFSEDRQKIITVKSGVMVGVCGYSRYNDVIQYGVEWDAPASPLFWHKHLATVIGPRIRDAMRAGGVLQMMDGMENTGGNLLIGTPDGRLFVMCEYLSVTEFTGRGYAAVGSGTPYALTVLAMTKGDPARRLSKAIKMAAQFDGGTNGRVYVVEGPVGL